ncbi:MAG: polysaccharide deacetylase family protein [Lachnospirales bacterium]
MHKFLTFSFDDGTVEDRRLIALFDRYGLQGTFNLNSGKFGVRREIVHEGIPVHHYVIEQEEAKTLYQNHEVAAHTVHHPNLVKISREEVIHEVADDCRALEELTGQRILGMAYPGAGLYYTQEVADIIRENTQIRYARGCKNHHTFKLPENLMLWEPTCHQNDPQLLELGKAFVQADASEEDLLFYVWGHSFEFEKFKSWDLFERFCEIVAGKPDIEYVTNGEVARYLMG